MLKILVIRHVPPNVREYASILFENLLPILKTKTAVQVMWLLYRPKKVDLSNIKVSDIAVLDIHDYDNAVEALQKLKPDIVYAIPGYSYVEYAFALACKFLKIPLIGGELGLPLYRNSSAITIIKSYFGQFFESYVSADSTEENKQFMKRGRFFIYKYLFLIKTQKKIGISLVEILRSIGSDLRRYLLQESKDGFVEPRFSCDLNFVDGENMIETLVKAGFKRSSLILTGNPTYDTIFQRVEKFQPIFHNENKAQILLITTNPNDPGGNWSKSLRDYWVKSIVSEVSKYKNEMLLSIKIHPSGEILSEYVSMVKPIDSSVTIYQKEDIVKLLQDIDVVIGSSSSTALVISLLTKKPIIIWNIYGVQDDALLERGLALKCDKLTELVPLIHKGLSSNSVSDEKIKDFIHEFFYNSDGKASERIADVILELAKK